MAVTLMTLEIGSSKYSIDSYDFEVYTPTAQQGFPSGNPQAGIINLVVSLPVTGGNEFESWATDLSVRDGTIFIEENKQTQIVSFGLSFYNAFCIRYRQVYIAPDTMDQALKNMPFKIHLTISAQCIQMQNNTKLENKWPGVASPSSSNNSNSQSQSKNSLDFS
ncbi:MAG: type VI secretion system tube protein TssD [Chitinophagaceae bacterium]